MKLYLHAQDGFLLHLVIVWFDVDQQRLLIGLIGRGVSLHGQTLHERTQLRELLFRAVTTDQQQFKFLLLRYK